MTDFTIIFDLLKEGALPLSQVKVKQIISLLSEDDLKVVHLQVIADKYEQIFKDDDDHKKFSTKINANRPDFWSLLSKIAEFNLYIIPELATHIDLLQYDQLVNLCKFDKNKYRTLKFGSKAFTHSLCTPEFEDFFIKLIQYHSPEMIEDFHHIFLKRKYFNPKLIELIIPSFRNIYLIQNMAIHSQSSLKIKQIALELLRKQSHLATANRQSNSDILKVIKRIHKTLGSSAEEQLTLLLS